MSTFRSRRLALGATTGAVALALLAVPLRPVSLLADTCGPESGELCTSNSTEICVNFGFFKLCYRYEKRTYYPEQKQELLADPTKES